jgi:hypothetical protein
VLEDAIHEIYSHNASGLSYETLYRRARRPSLPLHHARAHDWLRAVARDAPAQRCVFRAGALTRYVSLRLLLLPARNAYNMVLHKFGDRLYEGLTKTLKAHLRRVASQVEQAHGVAFLPELRKHWQDHNKSMQMIRCVARACCRTARSRPALTRCRLLSPLLSAAATF